MNEQNSCEETSKTSSAVEQPSKVMSECNKSLDNKSNEDNNSWDSMQTGVKPEIKEKTTYKRVESRYKQSAQKWINKRAEDSHNNPESDRVVGSRKPTPNSKGRSQKTSTPVSTNKSLNCSGFSVINRVNENQSKEMRPDFNKYGKALMTDRQCLASRKLPFGSDSASNPSVGHSNRLNPLTLGLENQTKTKEIENSLITSTYLQTVYMNLKAKQMRTDRKTNAFHKITQIWNQTIEMRNELSMNQKSVDSLQNTIESIEILDKQKIIFEKYLNIRSEMDSLFNRLSKLIEDQKLLLKIENCSQSDFDKLKELIQSLPNSQRLEIYSKLSKSSLNIENSKNISIDFNAFDSEFNECFHSFIKCVKILEKYERLENSLNPQKNLSIKKLF